MDRASSAGVGSRSSLPWKTDRPLHLAQMEMSPSWGVFAGSRGSTGSVIHGVLAERTPPCHNDVDIHLVHVRPNASVCKRLRRTDSLRLACETTKLDSPKSTGAKTNSSK